MKQINNNSFELYGNIFIHYTQLPHNATFEDIKTIVDKNNIIGVKHYVKVGEKCITCERKYTFIGNVIKTRYLHIYVHKRDFNSYILYSLREQKDGNFK